MDIKKNQQIWSEFTKAATRPFNPVFWGPIKKKADAAVEMFHHKMDLGMHRCVEEEEEEEKNHLTQVSKRTSLTLECNARL